MRIILIITLFFSFVLTACSVNKRDNKTPAPTIKKVSTSFFFDYSKDRSTYKSKRFLFGSSVEDRTGAYAHIFMDHYNTAGSANVEFDFNEEGNELIGKVVNPSYPNNKNKWQILVSFKVSKNYYEENSTDPSGRRSQDIVQRTDKSDPRARPFIDLELSSYTHHGLTNPYYSQVTQKVEDVEWSEDGKFLGFTITATSAKLSTEAQVVSRVNLLEMTPSESDFEETLYHRDNDRHTQILHQVGERPNHFGEKLKAVHWDINPRTKKKHKIHINNFPKEYQHVAVDAIESWNDVFEDIVGYRPLEHEITDRKYAFDLRYHTVHWVDDVRLSAGGPLGVGNVAADITNGKVLWTGAIVWGGLLDRYASGNIPSVDLGSDSTTSITHDMSHLISKKDAHWNAPRIDPPETGDFGSDFITYVTQSVSAVRESVVSDLVAEKKAELDSLVSQDKLTQTEANDQLDAYKKEAPDIVRTSKMVMSAEELKNFYLKLSDDSIALVDMDLNNGFSYLRNNPISYSSIIDDLGLTQENSEEKDFLTNKLSKNSEAYKSLPEELRKSGVELPNTYKSLSFDGENKAIDVLQSLNTAVKEMVSKKKPIDILDVKKGMIRYTLVHEIGHTLGLGHNFKSNIMPTKGDVPNTIYIDLLKDAKNGMINKSSIMGYPDGRTEVLTPYEKHKPGPNDVSRMKYLYQQKYPMYDKTSGGDSEYVWVDLKADGRIADQITQNGKKLTPGFLPNCNDTEASLYMDPFCNRHDRGYDARTLMDGYFSSYWDKLYRSLESNIDALKSRNYWGIERYLWSITSRTMSRGRLFHDYMRLKYADEIKSLRSTQGAIQTYKNILSFSKSCRSLDGLSSAELMNLRLDKEYKHFISRQAKGGYIINEFGDLCIATAKYYDNINQLLEIEGKEFTEIDYFNKRVNGGIVSGDSARDSGQMFGSWKRISLMPLKIKVMQNVLLPFAIMSTSYGDYPLYPYNRDDTSFSMSTLYPEEYLKVIRSLIQSGMSIDDKDSEPSIAKSLLYLGYFLRFQSNTRDYDIFPSEILDAISDQTKFRFSAAYIEVEANKIDNSEFAKTFKGSIYNQYNTVGKEPLGSIYLYTLGRFLMLAQSNSLVLPLSPIRWRTHSNGIAFGVKLDYAPNINFEELNAYSPRNYFIEKYESVLKQCILGDNEDRDNGLSSYFNTNNDFDGIKIPFDIDYNEINKSVNDNILAFSQAKNFDLNNCEAAIKNQRVLVLGASLLSGMLFPETEKFLEKGGN